MANLTGRYDADFYRNQKFKSRESAERMLSALLPLVGDVGSALDVGCGAGGWLATLAAMRPGLEYLGVDHPDVPKAEMFIDPARFSGRDLSKPLDLGRRFDLAMTLEVAEHIAASEADVFVGNLCAHADVVLFGAAIPLQGGTGHVNEQWPVYWIGRFAARGYQLFDVVRPLVWSDDAIAPWYKQNAMLFMKPPRAPAVEDLEDWRGRSLVHPGLWMRGAEPLKDKIVRVLSGKPPPL